MGNVARQYLRLRGWWAPFDCSQPNVRSSAHQHRTRSTCPTNSFLSRCSATGNTHNAFTIQEQRPEAILQPISVSAAVGWPTCTPEDFQVHPNDHTGFCVCLAVWLVHT